MVLHCLLLHEMKRKQNLYPIHVITRQTDSECIRGKKLMLANNATYHHKGKGIIKL